MDLPVGGKEEEKEGEKKGGRGECFAGEKMKRERQGDEKQEE